MADNDLKMDDSEEVKATAEEQVEEEQPVVAASPRTESGRKNLKLLAIILVVLAIGLTGFIVYGLANKSENATPPTSQSEVVTPAGEESTVPFVTLATSDGLQEVSSTGETTQILELDASQFVLATEGELTAVATANSQGTIASIEVFEGQDSLYSVLVSANNPYVEYSIFDFKNKALIGVTFSSQSTENLRVTSFTEDTPTGSVEYEADSDQDPILVPVVSTEGKIIAQQYSCFNCDGPPLVQLWLIDTATNTASKLYSPTNSSTLNAKEADLSPNQSKIYITATDVYAASGVTKEQLQDANHYVFEYDIDAKSGKQVYQEKAVWIQVAGFSDTANEILISRSVINTDEESANFFEAPILARLNTAAGSARDINLTSRTITVGTTLDNALSIGDQLFFRARNGSDSAGTVVNQLDLGEDSDGVIKSIASVDAGTAQYLYPTVFANSLQ